MTLSICVIELIIHQYQDLKRLKEKCLHISHKQYLKNIYQLNFVVIKMPKEIKHEKLIN